MAGPKNQGFCHVPAQGASPWPEGRLRRSHTLGPSLGHVPPSYVQASAKRLFLPRVRSVDFSTFQNYLGPPTRSGGFKTIWSHQQGPKVLRRSANTWLKEGQKGGEGVECGRGKTVSKCIIKGDLYVPKGCWATPLRQRDNSYPPLWRNLLSGL